MNTLDIIAGTFVVIGSIGLFLYGMKLMSEGLQKLAGNRMRKILAKMTSNPLKGVLTGTLITMTIQSSTATTVMVVSFVNAGLLSLSGAIGVIIGANIGTTGTAWVISLLGFSFSISSVAIPLIGVAIPFLFIKQSKYRSLGEFILGFALLFLGLEYLKNSFPDISLYPQVLEVVASLSSYGFLSTLLFVLIGTILTIVLQSSTAMMAVTIVMSSQGWISFEIAAAMVLGENIGTTITANVAALMANTAAKRAALAHFVFNIFGAIWLLIVFNPFLKGVDEIIFRTTGDYPSITAMAIPVALSLFHSSYNVINSLIFVWFIPQIKTIVEKIIKAPETEGEDDFRLKYISNRFLNASELNLELSKKEIVVFSERIIHMFEFLPQLDTLDNNHFEKLMDRIKKYEEISDRMEIEIASYLTKISISKLSDQGSRQIGSMLKIVDNLESLGDSIYQIALFKQSGREQKLVLSEHLMQNIEKMHTLVLAALNNMHKDLQDDYTSVEAKQGNEYEKQINTYRDVLREEHYEAVKNNTYSYEIGIVYSGIYALYEKTGDFIINVIEAIDSKDKNASHTSFISLQDMSGN